MATDSLLASLYRESTIPGLLLDRTGAELGDVSDVLHSLRSVPGVDFKQMHRTSSVDGHASLDDMAARNERLFLQFTNALDDASTPSRLADHAAKRLFAELQQHAADLGDALKALAASTHHPVARNAVVAVDSLELCATALVGLGDAYEAGRHAMAQSRAHPPSRRSNDDRAR